MNTSNDDYRDETNNSAYNPFPEPQTIPSGWDLSEIIAAPQIESVMDEDDSGES